MAAAISLSIIGLLRGQFGALELRLHSERAGDDDRLTRTNAAQEKHVPVRLASDLHVTSFEVRPAVALRLRDEDDRALVHENDRRVRNGYPGRLRSGLEQYGGEHRRSKLSRGVLVRSEERRVGKECRS